jgi:hypothetical protein
MAVFCMAVRDMLPSSRTDVGGISLSGLLCNRIADMSSAAFRCPESFETIVGNVWHANEAFSAGARGSSESLRRDTEGGRAVDLFGLTVLSHD